MAKFKFNNWWTGSGIGSYNRLVTYTAKVLVYKGFDFATQEYITDVIDTIKIPITNSFNLLA